MVNQRVITNINAPGGIAILLLLASICVLQRLGAEQEYGDACYRKLQMLGGQYDCSHAAIYIGMDSAGQHWVLEQGGTSSGIRTAWFSDMTDYDYYGSYTSVDSNPSFSTRRSIVQENGMDLLARSANIGYTWYDCLEPVNGYTSPIDTSEIQKLRCDGFVEFCYEAAGVDSWGKNGNNFSITTHHAEHNNFFEHGLFPNPDTEFCPCVQHGRIPGNSARLTRPSVIDVPVCSLTYVQHDGYTDVTITATDRSGIHRIRYSRGGIDSDWQDGPATGLHQTSDSLLFSFSINSACDVYAYAIDKAGNKPYSAPGFVVPVDRIPPPPDNVAASDDSFSNKIRVTWSASEGATSYEIWRNDSNNSSSAERIATLDSSPYDDTSAAAGTTYYYWVKAVNHIGTSTFGSPDSGRRQLPPCNVSTPDTPVIGPHIMVIGLRCFPLITGGSSCSNGHDIQYHFVWGDDSTSPWGDATQSHCYDASGNFSVRAQARCENGTVSDWSPAVNVVIAPVAPVTANLTMAVIGNGMITPVPGGHVVPLNVPQDITAEADVNWHFVNWTTTGSATVADTNAANTTVTLTADGTVTANFVEIQNSDFFFELYATWNTGINYTLRMLADAKYSDDYVAGEDYMTDLPLPPLPAPTAEEAFFQLPSSNVKLLWDSHFLDETVNMLTWQLMLAIPAGTYAELTWNEFHIPAGWLLFIRDDSSKNTLAMDAGASLLLETPGMHTFTITAIRESEYATFTYQLQRGWNMIGIPLKLTGESEEYLLEQNIMSINALGNSYEQPSTLTTGKAYWLFCENDTELTVDGTIVREYEIFVHPGWNFASPVSETAISCSDFVVWEWTNAGYREPEKDSDIFLLKAGKGYWIFSQ